MKMSELPGRIIRPMGEMAKPKREAGEFKSKLYTEAYNLPVGGTMKVDLRRGGITSRFKKAMPGRCFQQTKNGDHYVITRLPDAENPKMPPKEKE